MEAAVELCVRVRFIAGVDDGPGPGGRRGDALPDVVGPLRKRERGTVRGLQDLAGTRDQLPGDQEVDQDLGKAGELSTPRYEVILVTAIGVTS
ncbi:hypothetical protein D3C73_1410440 [compost metagenome]